MRKLIAAFLGAAFAVISATQLMAAVVPPIGLAPGSQYQLIFVTADAITPGSSNIADYNAFVTAEAALNPSLPPATWDVVGSTASVDANVNAPSEGVPVYNTQGIEVRVTATAAIRPRFGGSYTLVLPFRCSLQHPLRATKRVTNTSTAEGDKKALP